MTKQIIVIETHGGAEYASICTDSDGNNLVFETVEDARVEANDCQDGVILDITEAEPVRESNPQLLESAIELLQQVLTDSMIESDMDEPIYEFLRANDRLPADYVPYWKEAES